MRRWMVVAALAGLIGVTSGCSLREVQLWFAINKKQAISREQAKNLADLVNSKKPAGGCDGNYAGTCVPDNATSVHCVGAPGDGPAVRGPFTIAGWDSFELDPDGDKHVCDSPVGAFDVFGQRIGEIAIRGWAFDPDTPHSIQLAVSVNGYVEYVNATDSRGDLAAALPGVGVNHGFELYADGGDPGTTNSVCVVALNVFTGTNTTLGCKTVVMQDIAYSDDGVSDVYGLIEGADVVPGGIRVRGFAFVEGPSSVHFAIGAVPSLVSILPLDDKIVSPRADVEAAEPGAPELVGFDFVLPREGIFSFNTQVCLMYVGSSGDDQLMCRPLNT